MSELLTPQRLFGTPPLAGTPPTSLTLSPDGRWVIFRATTEADRSRYNLYRRYLQPDAEAELLLDTQSIAGAAEDATHLSAAERAERERRRDFSSGVTQYFWRPHHAQILVPVDSRVYLLDLQQPPQTATQLLGGEFRQSAFQVSPLGTYLSFVRERNLYFLDIARGACLQITHHSSPSVQSGLADFLAAEEMHRFQGHWWSPDETCLYFCTVDESVVTESYRLELEANGARTISQRYPYAGTANPTVALHRYDLATQNQVAIWSSETDGEYLARVNFRGNLPVIQTQDRLQQSLRYLQLDGSHWQQIWQEESATWVNLSDDFVALDNGTLFLTAEHTGTRQIVRIDTDNTVTDIPAVTHCNALLGSHAGALYATGWQDNPTENHLFALHEGQAPKQLTGPGWHDIVFDTKSGAWLDIASSNEQPLHITHHRDGATTSLYRESIGRGHPYHPYMAVHQQPRFGVLRRAGSPDLHYRFTPPLSTNNEPCPAIVYVYGGPGAQKVRNQWPPYLLQLFAQHGFGVFELDNRGSANRGRDFEAPLYTRMGSVEIEDQVAGLSVLAEFAEVDPARVGVFGHSYGGYMTLMCLCQAPEAFKAGVAVAPVCDWHLYDTHYTERYMGLPQQNAPAYERSNVLSHLPRLQAPLLLMHGMADDNVLFTHSTMIMGELQKLGKQFELMTYPGAKHSMQETHVSVHRFQLILDFFKRRL